MTEEAIKRAKEFSGHQAQKHFPMSFHESERKTAAFIGRVAYLQGMQDPDANHEKIKSLEAVVKVNTGVVEELMKDCAELDNLRDENKRLMEALEYYANEESWRESEAYAERLTICGDERLLKGHYLVGGRRATKALSSGGE